MTPPADFEDRLAARALGIGVDADPDEIRSQFRRLVRAVHPDTSVGVACVDLGRLAVAKQRLLARAEAREARCEEARRRVERLRLVEDPVEVIAVQARRQGAAVPRRRSAPAERLGLLVDLAG